MELIDAIIAPRIHSQLIPNTVSVENQTHLIETGIKNLIFLNL